jgi:hypothetical protein
VIEEAQIKAVINFDKKKLLMDGKKKRGSEKFSNFLPHEREMAQEIA